jgi:hypothetical protein
MADHEAPVTPEPAWRFLAQISLPNQAGDERRVAGLAIEALQDLALPAAQLRLVRDAIADAARQINTEGGATPVSITLRVSDRPAGGAPERQGWGCFVIRHRAEDVPAAEADAHSMIELYLYPEGGRDELD